MIKDTYDRMNMYIQCLVGKKLSKRKNTQYLHIFTDISCCLTLESFKYSFLLVSQPPSKWGLVFWIQNDDPNHWWSSLDSMGKDCHISLGRSNSNGDNVDSGLHSISYLYPVQVAKQRWYLVLSKFYLENCND